MKHIYIALLASLTASSQIMSQGVVTIRDAEENVVNGSVVFVASQPTDNTNEVDLLVELTGTTAEQINVRRYEVWPVAGSSNYFCWGVCYLPVLASAQPAWVSQHYVDMEAGIPVNNFHAYYQPTGNAGTSRFRYVWFNTSTPDSPDSSWVDIDFGGTVGLGDGPTRSISMAAWPNPTSGSDVMVDFALDGSAQNTEVVLYNVVGERVRRQRISSLEGRAVLSSSGLASGVYFANLERDGRMLATRRIAITR